MLVASVFCCVHLVPCALSLTAICITYQRFSSGCGFAPASIGVAPEAISELARVGDLARFPPHFRKVEDMSDGSIDQASRSSRFGASSSPTVRDQSGGGGLYAVLPRKGDVKQEPAASTRIPPDRSQHSPADQCGVQNNCFPHIWPQATTPAQMQNRLLNMESREEPVGPSIY